MKASGMDTIPPLLVLLACAPLLVFIIQMIAARVVPLVRPGTSAQVVALGCALIGNVPMAIAVWTVSLRYLVATPNKLVWAAVYSLLVYNAMAYSYFHVFNMGETSRRIRVLSEIYMSERLNISEIASVYGVNDILDLRLERLLSMNQIKRAGDRYLLDNRLLYYAARAVEFWARVLGLPSLLAGYRKARSKK